MSTTGTRSEYSARRLGVGVDVDVEFDVVEAEFVAKPAHCRFSLVAQMAPRAGDQGDAMVAGMVTDKYARRHAAIVLGTQRRIMGWATQQYRSCLFDSYRMPVRGAFWSYPASAAHTGSTTARLVYATPGPGSVSAVLTRRRAISPGHSAERDAMRRAKRLTPEGVSSGAGLRALAELVAAELNDLTRRLGTRLVPQPLGPSWQAMEATSTQAPATAATTKRGHRIGHRTSRTDPRPDRPAEGDDPDGISEEHVETWRLVTAPKAATARPSASSTTATSTPCSASSTSA